MRKVPLANGEVYHIFNRGVDKADIFYTDNDYKRFIKTFKYYLTRPSPKYSQRWLSGDHIGSEGRPLVEVFAYCLMPNHFHLILKQLIDNGITMLMRKVANSYSHYLNLKSKRIGPLFQGRFKNVLIENDEQLVHLSRYVHLNPVVARLVLRPENYPWSSFREYLDLDEQKEKICDSRLVLDNFKSRQSYETFVYDQVSYAKELDRIKHLTFD